MTPVLSVRGLSVNFGAVAALRDVNLDFPRNARVGLIGPNGAGKTTLLNTLAGFTAAANGRVELDGQNVLGKRTQYLVARGVVRGFQTVRLLEGETVDTNIMLGRHRFSGHSALEQILGSPRSRRAEKANADVVDSIAEMLGLSDVRDAPVGALSFGRRRLVEVARVLAAEPRVLLLDEPMAGLDARSRAELASLLVRAQEALGTTMVLVEHDTDVVRRVCNWIAVLDAGTVIAVGEPASVFESAKVREAYFGGRHHA